MSGMHRLISQDRQAVTSVSASHVRPSEAIRRASVSRQGNGRVELSGPYTGSSDTQIEIQIVGGGGPRITSPSFSGVGTGELTDQAVLAGATPQRWTITLVDLGTTTETARTDIEGVEIRARQTGAAGNTISISVDMSGISYAPTTWSLIDDLSEGTSEVTGAAWDWDTAVGIGDEVPSAARRIVIGNDRANIYVQWKVYDDGEWRYRFAPQIARDYPAGTPVYEVTGTRTVTVTDGVTVETYTGIVTLADLLTALRDTPSQLVEVVGVIDTSRSADNPAAIVDLRTRTDARVDSTSGSGSQYATGFVDYAVGPNANTEIIEARCYAATRKDGAGLGYERWRLRGSVSGDLGVLTSGESYAEPNGRFSLRIPRKVPDGYELGESRGGIGFDYRPTQRDEDAGEQKPSVGSKPLVLGSNAEDKTITFRYERRPGGDLDWTSVSPGGRLTTACIGVEVDDVSIDPEYRTRLQTVLDWRKSFIYGATRWKQESESVETRQCGVDETQVTKDVWIAYVTIRDDATGGQEAYYLARVVADYATQADADAASAAIDGKQITIDKNLQAGDRINVQVAPDTYTLEIVRNYWGWRVGGTPVSATITQEASQATTRTDTVTSPRYCVDRQWSPACYEADEYDIQIADQAIKIMVDCLEDVYGDATARQEWDNLWTEVSNELDTNLGAQGNQARCYNDRYFDRWRAACDRIRLIAGVLPKSDASPMTSGDGCWRDDPSATHWWVDTEGKYLPAFTNQIYVSSVIDQETGQPVSTKEFAMAILVDGEQYLKEGDEVVITIGDAGWPPTYQVGDRLYLATIAAQPLQLQGGVDGDDTLTWSVDGEASGKAQDYAMDTSAPALYDNGEIQFRITPGGVPFELGDRFTICVESGQFRWRRDGGAWSADLPIATTPLVDGLTATFIEGACPSFVSGDTTVFDVLQPHAPSGALAPDDPAWSWDGAAGDVTLTLNCSGIVDAVAIGRHDLPASAAVSVSDGSNTWPMPIRAGAAVLLLPTALISPTLTITISGVPDGRIGWVWAGQATALSSDADTQTQIRRWSVLAGAGRNPSRLRRGRGAGWRMSWPLNASESDLEALAAAIDTHLALGGAPAIWVPTVERPELASLVALPDAIDVSHLTAWSPTSDWVGLDLELSPWLYD